MTDNNDTIAAIATPFGNSGIGIIRISGNDSIKKANEIIRSRSGKCLDLISMLSHTVHYGYVMDDNEIIDEVLFTVFKSPRSFTAEDTVEINCHGGMYVLNKVLSVILSHGVRLADPGEFTKRAFLNGRIDLSQAESVMDLISSENDFSRNNSILQLKGSVKKKVEDLREIIIHETAIIEAALDDPEHYEIDIDYRSKLKCILTRLSENIKSIINDSDRAVYLCNGINTVIAGKPNVGKSSLLNLLSGYERAIVTSVPGTTRDTIKEKIHLDEIILNMIDTAGIHESEDEVENIGISRTFDEIRKADLVLFMIDSSAGIDDEDRLIAKKIYEKNTIIILNKTDKTMVTNKEEINKIINSPVIEMSIKENRGLDELKALIKDLFIKGSIKDNEVYITNKRHIDLFNKAFDSISLVIKSIDDNVSEDVYTVDLMDAYAYLGEIIGEDISDDLVDRIFSEFCMGK